MNLIYIFILNVLLFIILFSMLCSCKNNKLNKIINKLVKKINQLFNNVLEFLNIDEENNKLDISEDEFPNYLGPNHMRF